jgi:hypothetical protein
MPMSAGSLKRWQTSGFRMDEGIQFNGIGLTSVQTLPLKTTPTAV